MGWDGLSGGQKAALVIVGMVVFGTMCDSMGNKSAQAPARLVEPRAQSSEDVALMACLAAQREVKKQLKAPATADFPSCASALHEYKINANAEMTKVGVQGYVDSQNSFGANIRSRFVVLFDKGPGTGSSDFVPYKIAVE